jgi:methionyl aminopeptidase
VAKQQSTPPRVPLADLFPNEQYPTGQIIDYTVKHEGVKRTTAQELRHIAAVKNMDADFIKDYRKAAEVHRQVRQHAQALAKPGVTMSHLATEIEEGVRALVGHHGLEPGDALKGGMGFPTGLCLNHVAAHWTPNPGGKEVVLGYDDVLSIDFGVHVNGRIVDSAFTVAANPVYDPLLEAVKAATNTGLKVRHTILGSAHSHIAHLKNRKQALTHASPRSAVQSKKSWNLMK